MSEREDLDKLYFEALKVEESGDKVRAFSLFMQAATLGDDASQNAVGLAYDSGAGVDKDKDKAIAWFKKAWRTGNQPFYCENIALTYAETGRHRRAVYWWRKAIARGDGDAALALAKLLMKSNRRDVANQVLELLSMAADCQEYLDITPAGKEEASELLDRLSFKS